MLALIVLAGCSGSSDPQVAADAAEETAAAVDEPSPSPTPAVTAVDPQDLLVPPPTDILKPDPEKPDVITPENLEEVMSYLGPEGAKAELESWRRDGLLRSVQWNFGGPGGDTGLLTGGIFISIFEDTVPVTPPYAGEWKRTALTTPELPAGLTGECQRTDKAKTDDAPWAGTNAQCEFIWPDQKMRIRMGIFGPGGDKVADTTLAWAQALVDKLPSA